MQDIIDHIFTKFKIDFKCLLLRTVKSCTIDRFQHYNAFLKSNCLVLVQVHS